MEGRGGLNEESGGVLGPSDVMGSCTLNNRGGKGMRNEARKVLDMADLPMESMDEDASLLFCCSPNSLLKDGGAVEGCGMLLLAVCRFLPSMFPLSIHSCRVATQLSPPRSFGLALSLNELSLQSSSTSLKFSDGVPDTRFCDRKTRTEGRTEGCCVSHAECCSAGWSRLIRRSLSDWPDC